MAVNAGVLECDCSFIARTDMSHLVTSAVRKVSRARACSRSEKANHSSSTPCDDGMNMDDIREYQKATCYFREFLAKGHPNLGRKGPTCPFVPVALKKNSLYLATVRTQGPTSRNVVERVARQFVKRYPTLEPKEGKMEVYKAVLLIFPGVALEDAHECIDQVQAALKPEFVKQGLMIGEFHLNNNASGLRNPDFYPLRTATPCLAIRRIVPTDLAFLDMSKYNAQIRVAFLEAYLKQFQGAKLSKIDQKSMAEAEVALVKARTEM